MLRRGARRSCDTLYTNASSSRLVASTLAAWRRIWSSAARRSAARAKSRPFGHPFDQGPVGFVGALERIDPVPPAAFDDQAVDVPPPDRAKGLFRFLEPEAQVLNRPVRIRRLAFLQGGLLHGVFSAGARP